MRFHEQLLVVLLWGIHSPLIRGALQIWIATEYPGYQRKCSPDLFYFGHEIHLDFFFFRVRGSIRLPKTPTQGHICHISKQRRYSSAEWVRIESTFKENGVVQ